MRTELVNKVAEEIKSKRPSTSSNEIYDCHSFEGMQEYTKIDGVSVNYNYHYGYVDVVGLTDEEFKSLLEQFD